MTLDESATFNRWAEEQFLREYPDAVRAPPGSPYDFAVGPDQVEVKGIAYTWHVGTITRRGCVFIQMESHRAFGLMPCPLYYIFIYNGTTRHKVLRWVEMDRLIRSYKTFTRNSYPKGVECVKVGYKRLMGQ